MYIRTQRVLAVGVSEPAQTSMTDGVFRRQADDRLHGCFFYLVHKTKKDYPSDDE